MVKNLVEKFTGAKIFRNSLPRGVSLSHDLGILYPDEIKLIWDVGAHQGESTLAFAKEFPNAFINSFEPVSENYERLIENCTHLKNQSSHKLAFGDSKKELKLFLQEASVIHSLRDDLNIPKGDDQESQLIRQDTVDSFLSMSNSPKIDLLKIDVEGYELSVLKGASDCLAERRINFIYLETGLDTRFNTLETIVSKLNPYGFFPYAFYEQNAHWSGKQNLWYWNTLFVKENLL